MQPLKTDTEVVDMMITAHERCVRAYRDEPDLRMTYDIFAQAEYNRVRSCRIDWFAVKRPNLSRLLAAMPATALTYSLIEALDDNFRDS
jgi:hypothetical protein